jgi:hypothetical protein
MIMMMMMVVGGGHDYDDKYHDGDDDGDGRCVRPLAPHPCTPPPLARRWLILHAAGSRPWPIQGSQQR